MQGLLVNEHAVEQVERHAADAVANGAKVMAGGRRHARDRAFRVGEELEYGMVGINSAILSTEVAPFGGVRESGLGREESRHGIEEFVEIRYVLVLQPTEAVDSGRHAPSFRRAMQVFDCCW